MGLSCHHRLLPASKAARIRAVLASAHCAGASTLRTDSCSQRSLGCLLRHGVASLRLRVCTFGLDRTTRTLVRQVSHSTGLGLSFSFVFTNQQVTECVHINVDWDLRLYCTATDGGAFVDVAVLGPGALFVVVKVGPPPPGARQGPAERATVRLPWKAAEVVDVLSGETVCTDCISFVGYSYGLDLTRGYYVRA